MAISNALILFLIISSAFVGDSQDAVGGGGATSLPCVQKLLPCQMYLKTPGNPPATCCLPLRELVVTDRACLCQVFNNQGLLQALNVTQQDGLNLVQACGANADTSLCQAGGGSPPATPGTPTDPRPADGSNITVGGSPPAPEKKSGAASSWQAGQYLSMAVALFTSLFL